MMTLFITILSPTLIVKKSNIYSPLECLFRFSPACYSPKYQNEREITPAVRPTPNRLSFLLD
jgi:hypothetical protein